MNQEHEQGIRALKNCLQGCKNLGKTISEMHFERAGITPEDLKSFESGEKYMTEEQFYGFHYLLRAPRLLAKPLIDWLNLGDNWAIVGILEPTFSLNGKLVRAIIDFPYVIINNPDIKFKVGDSLIHTCPNGLQEELFIIHFEYSFFPKGYKPVYTLTVTRSKQDMQNTNSFTFGDNTQISGNTHFNTGNVTDNSSNTFNELTPDFFVQTRGMLESITSIHKQELIDLIEKIENAKSSGNKNEGGQLLGKFLSLSFIADCVTVLQPALGALFNYFVH